MASVEVVPDELDLTVGETVQLSVSISDAAGNPLTDRILTWSSDDNTVATVDGGGTVAAQGAGSTNVIASSEGEADTATVTVVEPSPIIIDSISPNPLVVGGTATIHGEGFSATAANNTVELEGTVATVLTSTATTIEFEVPDACVPPGTAAVIVSAFGGTSEPFPHGFEPTGASVDVAAGEQIILFDPSSFCLRFSASSAEEAYLVGLQSTSSAVSSMTSARLTSRTAGGSAGVLPLPSLSVARPTLERGPTPSEWRWARHRAAESELRRKERQKLEMLLPAVAPAPSALYRVPPDVAIGDTVEIRVPDVDGDLCNDFFTLDAAVREIGTHGVWMEDVSNPVDGFDTAAFQELSDDFDDVIYPTNVSYFGEPTDRDGDGRVAILVTRRVNATENLLGFVSAGDLFSTAECPASNFAEIYYGKAPDPAGDFGDPYDLETAAADAKSLIAHEFAHVIQFGRRMDTPGASQFQSVWEAEGQASFAEEVVGFAFNGRMPYQNYGIDVMLEPTVGIAGDTVRWHEAKLSVLASYYGWNGLGGTSAGKITGAPEECSWVGRPPNGPCINSPRLPYEVTWSLLRYISDQYGPTYPGGEQGLHQDLIETTSSGFAVLEEVTGESIEVLLARWAAALYVDDRVPVDPSLEFTTWNWFDVFTSVIDAAALQPYEHGFEAFQRDVSVRGGSTAYFRVSGAGRPATAIEATTGAGGTLPGVMQVWVVRLQ